LTCLLGGMDFTCNTVVQRRLATHLPCLVERGCRHDHLPWAERLAEVIDVEGVTEATAERLVALLDELSVDTGELKAHEHRGPVCMSPDGEKDA
jgi:hypothetical protein